MQLLQSTMPAIYALYTILSFLPSAVLGLELKAYTINHSTSLFL
jgi:hypothetical protein